MIAKLKRWVQRLFFWRFPRWEKMGVNISEEDEWGMVPIYVSLQGGNLCASDLIPVRSLHDLPRKEAGTRAKNISDTLCVAIQTSIFSAATPIYLSVDPDGEVLMAIPPKYR